MSDVDVVVKFVFFGMRASLTRNGYTRRLRRVLRLIVDSSVVYLLITKVFDNLLEADVSRLQPFRLGRLLVALIRAGCVGCWRGDRKGIRPVKTWVLVCWW